MSMVMLKFERDRDDAYMVTMHAQKKDHGFEDVELWQMWDWEMVGCTHVDNVFALCPTAYDKLNAAESVVIVQAEMLVPWSGERA